METGNETLDSVTVSQFQDVIDEWHRVRTEIDRIEDSVKPLSEKRRELESQIFKMFEATGLDKFQGRIGGVERRKVEYANNPTEENRDKFITYLQETGQLNDVITFHQGRLTSWYKSKKEEYGFDFKPPGLDDLKERYELRKKK